MEITCICAKVIFAYGCDSLVRYKTIWRQPKLLIIQGHHTERNKN